MSFWDKVKKLMSGEDSAASENKEVEITAGGSTVYRYEEQPEEKKDPRNLFPEIQCVYLEEIEEHLTKYIAPPEMVFHEIVSELVHIDVHWIKPSADYPFNILVTSGMSDLPMHVPDELENKESYERAELMVVLPADWAIGEQEFQDDNNYWPVYFLKRLARFPHEYKTWLGYGHTIPNGADAEEIANTGFGCMLLLPPMLSFGEEFLELKTKDGNVINFYAMIPIYKEEMDYKLEEGTDALLDRFDEYGISELVDVDRPNVCH
ncbi:suppressor of fused domain protein [Sphingobacterium thalpophilum]|uniref:Suppressor of fused domain protein n=2 Tax=Sphingobacterium thalpophilum TaxID=259 RepID=A0ABV4H7D3_9SPHI